MSMCAVVCLCPEQCRSGMHTGSPPASSFPVATAPDLVSYTQEIIAELFDDLGCFSGQDGRCVLPDQYGLVCLDQHQSVGLRWKARTTTGRR